MLVFTSEFGTCPPQAVEWHWVRGHAGHPENERCDELARAAIKAGVKR